MVYGGRYGVPDRPEYIRDALNVIELEFEGIDAYVQQHTSLRPDDFERIRNNSLVIAAAQAQ